MNRAIPTLSLFAALALAACSGDRSEDPGAEPQADAQAPAGEVQPQPADPGASQSTPNQAPVTPAPGEEGARPLPEGMGGGAQMRYADCMRQARDAAGPAKANIEAACKRLPDAPK